MRAGFATPVSMLQDETGSSEPPAYHYMVPLESLTAHAPPGGGTGPSTANEGPVETRAPVAPPPATPSPIGGGAKSATTTAGGVTVDALLEAAAAEASAATAEAVASLVASSSPKAAAAAAAGAAGSSPPPAAAEPVKKPLPRRTPAWASYTAGLAAPVGHKNMRFDDSGGGDESGGDELYG